MAEGLGFVALLARDSEPEHVHRCTEILADEARFFAHGGVSAIGAEDELGADFELAVRRLRTQPDDAVALLDQIGRLGLHAQVEGPVALAVRGEKIEEVPLRHQRDEFAVGRQVPQINHAHVLVADLCAELLHLLVRQLEKFIQQAELVHQLERGRMDGVAAEVAEEVSVFLKDHYVDAGARQQEAEHHAGRSAAGDTAFGWDRVRRHGILACAEPAGRRDGGQAGCAVCGATPSFFCRLDDDVVYWNTNRFSG